jgi:hypothetical protein
VIANEWIPESIPPCVGDRVVLLGWDVDVANDSSLIADLGTWDGAAWCPESFTMRVVLWTPLPEGL